MPVGAQTILEVILAHRICGVIPLPSGGQVTYWMGRGREAAPRGLPLTS